MYARWGNWICVDQKPALWDPIFSFFVFTILRNLGKMNFSQIIKDKAIQLKFQIPEWRHGTPFRMPLFMPPKSLELSSNNQITTAKSHAVPLATFYQAL